MFVGGKLVSWMSKKQPVIARSTAEVELKGYDIRSCRDVVAEKIT
jgi:hypothetical protein